MNNKKKKLKKRILCVLILIVIVLVTTYNYFYGKTKHLTGGIKITSSCILNLMPSTGDDYEEEENKEALFIFLIKGITRDEFLKKYDVLEININGESVSLEETEYIHLNNELSIRVYSENYKEGNIVEITVRDKSKLQDIKKRLYNTTEVVE